MSTYLKETSEYKNNTELFSVLTLENLTQLERERPIWWVSLTKLIDFSDLREYNHYIKPFKVSIEALTCYASAIHCMLNGVCIDDLSDKAQFLSELKSHARSITNPRVPINKSDNVINFEIGSNNKTPRFKIPRPITDEITAIII